MTFDLGQGAFQGARKTLKHDHTVAVTNSMEMRLMHFGPATVFGSYASCLILPAWVGLMGMRTHVAAESTGVPRASRGPCFAAELLCLQPKALHLCWD